MYSKTFKNTDGTERTIYFRCGSRTRLALRIIRKYYWQSLRDYAAHYRWLRKTVNRPNTPQPEYCKIFPKAVQQFNQDTKEWEWNSPHRQTLPEGVNLEDLKGLEFEPAVVCSQMMEMNIIQLADQIVEWYDSRGKLKNHTLERRYNNLEAVK